MEPLFAASAVAGIANFARSLLPERNGTGFSDPIHEQVDTNRPPVTFNWRNPVRVTPERTRPATEWFGNSMRIFPD